MMDHSAHDLETGPTAHSRQSELTRRVLRLTHEDGIFRSTIAPLSLIRISNTTERMPCVAEPSLFVAIQGRKRMELSGQPFIYDPLHYLVVSLALPVTGQVIEASPQTPYLCARLDIDLAMLSELLLEYDPGEPTNDSDGRRGLFIARMSDSLIDAVLRLVRLLDTPHDIPALAPLILREIHYRVLCGELGYRLRDLAGINGQSKSIVEVIQLLKSRYAEPLRIEDLAAAVHMSPSTLHHRFKDLTSMSPLQFQKQLRLHEARRLMLNEGVNASTASYRVGYNSPSQFSREYRRLFGTPPYQEIAQQREATTGNLLAGQV
ncbi:AraC family transcriptional regulator [Billgrantia tianxiuensis]|jgi:AraC-like DNA-binding protein|uniref:AraC family transcriptional regulator n=1 Tax=Billgrantia tianxiuensis TaxID=2497861 RepID=A0A6I6SKU5_9GAMM|nr:MULTISPECIES: AraC family transcriptional regulator [Halomonas]MCE8034874.1 AraC family transcriptional regulator [Halomonas sp. MCCC 1A11057]QHC48590.1 AraC family transcriptional regulator [Halomonas tianxiuensis]